MIYYVNQDNIDHRVLEKVKRELDAGNLIAFPTDTNWSIGCKAYSKKGLSLLQTLKANTKHLFTLVCSNISQVTEFARVDNRNFKILKKNTPGPLVFILPALQKIEKKINMKRSEIGVRIPENSIPLTLVDYMGTPLLVITASRELVDNEWWTKEIAEENLFEFGWELEEIKEISCIIDVDTGESQPKVLTTVVSLLNDEIEIIREGIGTIS